MTTTTVPRIYVACLASYNNGVLFGRWIDADMHSDDIQTDIETMLADSPAPDAEEWAIHDYEGFQGFDVGEWGDIDDLAETARLVIEHGSAYALYSANVGNDYANESDFQDSYCGEYESETAYAEGLADDLYGDLDNPLWPYFDYEKFARDLFCGGDYWSAEDGSVVHVFNR